MHIMQFQLTADTIVHQQNAFEVPASMYIYDLKNACMAIIKYS